MMYTQIRFSSELESFIRSQVATGMYANTTEVIRHALRLLRAEVTAGGGQAYPARTPAEVLEDMITSNSPPKKNGRATK